MNVFEIAEIFVDHVRRTCPENVDIIACYGSQVTGTATSTSDLDLYYIPGEGKEEGLYRSFIYQGLTFEFWPVTWAFAEKIASARHHWSVAPALIHNARVLYARDEESQKRFQALKDQITARLKPETRREMVHLAIDAFKSCAFHLENLRLACRASDLAGARWEGFCLVSALLDSLALANQTFFYKDWTADLEPALQMHIRPTKLHQQIHTLCTTNDLDAIERSATQLANETRALLASEQNSLASATIVRNVFVHAYPGIHEYVQKALSSCETGNLLKLSYALSKLQNDVAVMLAQTVTGFDSTDFYIYDEYRAEYERLGFSDLSGLLEKQDFDLVREEILRFDQRIRKFLSSHAVDLNEIETDELEHTIRQ